MLLIQCREWLGAGRKMTTEREREAARSVEYDKQVTFATRLNLSAALLILLNYQRIYNGHYTLAVEFTLLGVQTLPEDLPQGVLDSLNVRLIESLPKNADELG